MTSPMLIANNQKTTRLHDAVAAVAKIYGVSVGDWGDKTTWRVDFQDKTTRKQRSDADAVIAAFDPEA